VIAKATPTVTAPPTAGTITSGQTLAFATLTGGSGSTAGSFAFTTPDTVPDAGTASQPVTFTPTDGANYNTASTMVNVTVDAAASGYSTWTGTNAGGAAADVDTDNDGVPNGVEYFMNSATGFTANPPLVTTAGVRTITWTNGGNIPSTAYGTQFVVQTSQVLGIWTTVLSGDPNLSNVSGAVSYTLPTGAGKIFVRLVVTPN
jgi:hypothetical protein